MSHAAKLRGIAWAHTRATGPLHVTAQAFADLNPGVEISWDARSLWAFGEATLDSLADDYDLIVLDHPMIGYAVERSLLVPLDDHVESAWLHGQAQASVGCSHESYRYQGHQWAAAIDAACPVSVCREDLMAAAGCRVPRNWSEVIDLARTSGRVAVPLKPIDTLSLFITLCANQGGAPLDAATGAVVEPDLGAHVLDQMSELVGVIGRGCLSLNPIDVLTTMSITDEILYCPHAYGYSNYSRRGYAPRRVTFGAFPGPSEPWSSGTTLGGAGLAVSSRCRDLSAAFDYLMWVAGEECQRSTYVFAGGQPGHAAAWDDDLANEITRDFFRRTRSTIDRTFVRPRHPGMHAFQAAAAGTLRSFMEGERDAVRTLELLDQSFLDSLGPDEWSATAGGA